MMHLNDSMQEPHRQGHLHHFSLYDVVGRPLRLCKPVRVFQSGAVQEKRNNRSYAEGTKACSEDFRSCAGPAGAAEFIENAPH